MLKEIGRSILRFRSCFDAAGSSRESTFLLCRRSQIEQPSVPDHRGTRLRGLSPETSRLDFYLTLPIAPVADDRPSKASAF